MRKPRYIDANLVIEKSASSTDFVIAKDTPEIDAFVVRVTYGEIKKFVDEIPTDEDVIKVVRCKNCKHRYVPCRCALWYGTFNNKDLFVERGEDFYCSHGELKERER